ncbi:MAG: InlB B-repeat-containing protein, partial [Eggerthellaceae bacterium]|nr:InlB B-repeat-containing protein [Eggerthellaceae bacterium]
MILSAKRYEGQDAADTEAKAKADAPTDPVHDGYEFVGWVVNQDEFGDYVLVAKYNEPVVPEPAKTVSYIDPQSGQIVVKSVDASDPAATEPPAAPSHAGLQFVGWERGVDANGNVVYAAKYASDCQN